MIPNDRTQSTYMKQKTRVEILVTKMADELCKTRSIYNK